MRKVLAGIILTATLMSAHVGPALSAPKRGGSEKPKAPAPKPDEHHSTPRPGTTPPAWGLNDHCGPKGGHRTPGNGPRGNCGKPASP